MDTAAQAKESGFVNALRNRKTRSLSLGERQEIAELAATKPKIDLDIQFDYNSADISKGSASAVQELGKALSNPDLKGSTFVVAGHTDAIGAEAYNQELSERRADTIKKYLTEKYGIVGANLVTVGYGESKPKDANVPMDPTNRRVQVVNMDTKTAVEVSSIKTRSACPRGRRISYCAVKSYQIQFWKIISRLNVAIDVPMNAADIGSIAAKPAKPIAT